MFDFFQSVYDFFMNDESLSKDDLQEIYSPTLQKRMQSLVKRPHFHPYKGHIVTLKSKEILHYLNKTGSEVNFSEKCTNFNKILVNVSKSLYLKYNPNMIYSFNDEINLVFFHDESDTDYVYKGDIYKTVTMMSSFASIQFTKEFAAANIDLDFLINGKFVEFKEDYEMLNYIIWRQNDCYRNNLAVLHNHFTNTKSSMKITELILNLEQLEKEKQEADGVKRSNFGMDMSFFYGNIIKKEIVYKEINGKMICKKEFNVDNRTVLKWNFSENLQKYVYNKLL
jgi:tRNA(His) 5'-end guanylyltransferase